MHGRVLQELRTFARAPLAARRSLLPGWTLSQAPFDRNLKTSDTTIRGSRNQTRGDGVPQYTGGVKRAQQIFEAPRRVLQYLKRIILPLVLLRDQRDNIVQLGELGKFHAVNMTAAILIRHDADRCYPANRLAILRRSFWRERFEPRVREGKRDREREREREREAGEPIRDSRTRTQPIDEEISPHVLKLNRGFSMLARLANPGCQT